MTHDRALLSAKLKEVLGSNNVYFQAPTTMTYPCIKYDLDNPDIMHFDNTRHERSRKYTVTHMYKSTTNEMISKMLSSFMYISYDRQFKSDGIYHDVYTIYW